MLLTVVCLPVSSYVQLISGLVLHDVTFACSIRCIESYSMPGKPCSCVPCINIVQHRKTAALLADAHLAVM